MEGQGGSWMALARARQEIICRSSRPEPPSLALMSHPPDLSDLSQQELHQCCLILGESFH